MWAGLCGVCVGKQSGRNPVRKVKKPLSRTQRRAREEFWAEWKRGVLRQVLVHFDLRMHMCTQSHVLNSFLWVLFPRRKDTASTVSADWELRTYTCLHFTSAGKTLIAAELSHVRWSSAGCDFSSTPRLCRPWALVSEAQRKMDGCSQALQKKI